MAIYKYDLSQSACMLGVSSELVLFIDTVVKMALLVYMFILNLFSSRVFITQFLALLYESAGSYCCHFDISIDVCISVGVTLKVLCQSCLIFFISSTTSQKHLILGE